MRKIDGPEDPERCEGGNKHGQCQHKAMPGTNKCEIHGGIQATRKIERKASHDYDCGIYTARINHFSDSDRLKSLNGEIAVSRMTLERVLNMCGAGEDNGNMLLMHAPLIMSMTNNIRALVEVLQKLEERNSLLLNRTQVQSFAQQVLKIVTKYVTDVDTLDKIATEIERVHDEAGADSDADGRA